VRFTLERTAGPDLEPVTVAQIKGELGEFASVTDRDTSLEEKITAAREWAEDFTGRALFDQTWVLSLQPDSFVPYSQGTDSVASYVPRAGYYQGNLQLGQNGIYLRKSPALQLLSVVTVGADGYDTPMDASAYQLRDAGTKYPRLVLLNGGTWGSDELRITFRAGFADRTGSPQQDASVIPARFRQAIKLHVEAFYDKDQVMMEKLLKAAENLLRPERCELGFA
jgi:hypothetical protein